MDRLKESFDNIAKTRNIGIIPYLTVGFPTVADTLSLVPALVRGGADVIELGIPYSDPLADGPTIQRSSSHALQQGVNLGTCLGVCSDLRSEGITIPIVLMGYYNPILHYGLDRFAADADKAGVDGLIVPDLPFEESSALHKSCRDNGIHLIPLLAPTSSDTRIAQTCANASGFIYCVSLTGVTGARADLAVSAPTLIQRVRKHTNLPLAIGFGISTKEHVDAVAPWAQAVVIGSALIEIVEKSPAAKREDAVTHFVTGFRDSNHTKGGN